MEAHATLPSFAVRLDTIRLNPRVQGSEKNRFWQSAAIFENPDEYGSLVALFESRLVDRFGIELHRSIAEHFRALSQGAVSSDGGLTAERERNLTSVYFRVVGVEYGSIEVSLAVEGADNLVSLFNENFDLFTHVVEQYAPEAFIRAVPAEWQPAQRLEASLTNVHQIRAFFATRQIASAGGTVAGTSTKREHARALWIAANTSLLVPVGLALGVLYFGYRALDSERARIDARAARVDAREEQLLKLLADQAAISRPPSPAPPVSAPPTTRP